MLVGELHQGAPSAGTIDLEAVVVAAQLLVRLAQARGQGGRLGQGQVQVRDIVEEMVAGAPAAAESAGEGQIDLLRAVFFELCGGAGVIFQHAAGVDPQPLGIAQSGADIDVVIAAAAGAVGHLRAQGIGCEVAAGDLEGLARSPFGMGPGERIDKESLAGDALDGDEIEVGAAGEGIVEAESVIDEVEPGGRRGEEGARSGEADAARVVE